MIYVKNQSRDGHGAVIPVDNSRDSDQMFTR